jgi:hypothetical protein
VLAPCPLCRWHETENARTMAENSDAIFFLLPMNKMNTIHEQDFGSMGMADTAVSYKSVVSFFSGKFGTFIQ